MSPHPYKILSVGGSIIIPKTGFDIPFLKQFREFILSEVQKGERFILVIGGGTTCRTYQQAARDIRPMTEEGLDWIGIHATVFNAQFIQSLLQEESDIQIITNPTKKIKTKKPIIIAAGWKPGWSTDYVSVRLAKTYGAKEIFNLSNIAHVYSADPSENHDAKKIEQIDWKTFRNEIVGHEWKAGSSAPFDPVASREAEKLRLTVFVLNGTNIREVKKAVAGQKFTGTIIHPL